LNDKELLIELINVKLENIKLKQELVKEKKESVMTGVIDIILFIIWAVVMIIIL